MVTAGFPNKVLYKEYFVMSTKYNFDVPLNVIFFHTHFYFLALRSRYTSKHLTLKHPPCVFFSCSERSGHTSIFIPSSLSYICHGVGPLVDPFRSHISRSLFKSLRWFLLPVGECCFITLGNLLRGILFTCCIQFLLYSIDLSKIVVIFNSFAVCAFVL